MVNSLANMTTGGLTCRIDGSEWLWPHVLWPRITSLWGFLNTFFARIIVSLARTSVSHFPLQPILALLRWIVATSHIPELLWIKLNNKDCISRSSYGICLVELLLLGILLIFGLRFAISTTRLPTFQRTPEAYAFIYFIGIGCPGLWLAMLWWSCLVT